MPQGDPRIWRKVPSYLPTAPPPNSDNLEGNRELQLSLSIVERMWQFLSGGFLL